MRLSQTSSTDAWPGRVSLRKRKRERERETRSAKWWRRGQLLEVLPTQWARGCFFWHEEGTQNTGSKQIRECQVMERQTRRGFTTHTCLRSMCRHLPFVRNRREISAWAQWQIGRWPVRTNQKSGAPQFGLPTARKHSVLTLLPLNGQSRCRDLLKKLSPWILCFRFTYFSPRLSWKTWRLFE